MSLSIKKWKTIIVTLLGRVVLRRLLTADYGEPFLSSSLNFYRVTLQKPNDKMSTILQVGVRDSMMTRHWALSAFFFTWVAIRIRGWWDESWYVCESQRSSVRGEVIRGDYFVIGNSLHVMHVSITPVSLWVEHRF